MFASFTLLLCINRIVLFWLGLRLGRYQGIAGISACVSIIGRFCFSGRLIPFRGGICWWILPIFVRFVLRWRSGVIGLFWLVWLVWFFWLIIFPLSVKNDRAVVFRAEVFHQLFVFITDSCSIGRSIP